VRHMSAGWTSRTLTCLRFARSSDRGAHLIEYAMVAPVLIVVLISIAEFGLVLQAYQVVSNAAREGARMGTLACEPGSSTCYSSGDIASRVSAFVAAGLPTAATPSTTASCVSVDPGASGPSFIGEQVQVTYTYQFKFLGPIGRMIGGNFTSLPMSFVSTMRRE